jgi:opacity protein-like surface antigen
MKKMMLLGALLLSASAGFAQESRQDVSISGTALWGPNVNGNAVQMYTTVTTGILASYRYMLTPHSALEGNYQFSQDSTRFVISSLPNGRVHTRNQEITAAYVYSLNFRNFNPFAEVGVGTIFFSPIKDYGTTLLDTKRTTSIGALTGVGLAYELSPSFDVRVEYRGMIVKAPTFGLTNFTTGRYEFVSTPSLGVAYHF